MVRWVYWHSIKHTDGRRPSGVGRNVSLWHVIGDNWDDDSRTLCGREAQIVIRVVDGDPYTGGHSRYDDLMRLGKCRACMATLERSQRERAV